MIKIHLTGQKGIIGPRDIRALDFNRKNLISPGVMSEVFLQQIGGRKVAVKTAPLSVRDGGFFIENEARVLRALGHPNIPKFYRSWKIGKKVYLAMEYFKGRTADSIVFSGEKEAAGRRRLPMAIFITLAVAEALAHCHERGIVHVDIKPQNILFKGNFVKLIDFAFARPTGKWLDVERKPPEIRVFGTNGYLSIDRVAGKPPREADDLFALGVSLYEMLTGETAIAESKLTQDLIGFGRKIEVLDVQEPVKELLFRMTGLGRELKGEAGQALHDGRDLLNYLKSEIPHII